MYSTRSCPSVYVSYAKLHISISVTQRKRGTNFIFKAKLKHYYCVFRPMRSFCWGSSGGQYRPRVEANTATAPRGAAPVLIQPPHAAPDACVHLVRVCVRHTHTNTRTLRSDTLLQLQLPPPSPSSPSFDVAPCPYVGVSYLRWFI